MRQFFVRSILPSLFGVRRAGPAAQAPAVGEAAHIPRSEPRRSAFASESAAPSLPAPTLSTGRTALAQGVTVILAVCLATVGILGLYADTAASIVAIWLRSQTFAHGFVVIPICLWLVWRRRDALVGIPARPWWLALLGVLAAGALWLAASAADTLGVKQFALAFMLQAAILTIVGKRLGKALAFPLAFLLFAVPAGELFIPTLIDWTADFTVAALRWSGVPVYREANHFTIPTGSWSVIEACSGLRYIIASVMVGTMYAAIAYRSTRRRVAFFAASILVPIVANWVRAYMIVMLAHLTDNKIAVGVDHLIYGWLFFGAVMVILFWVGSFWLEPEASPSATGEARTDPIGALRSAAAPLFAAAIAAILAAGLWLPIQQALARPGGTTAPVLRALEGEHGWTLSDASISAWKPRYTGFASELSQAFEKDHRTVGLYLAYFRNQEKGHEMVTSGNLLVKRIEWNWKQLSMGADRIDWAGTSEQVRRAEIAGLDSHLDIYLLYWVNGTITSSDYVAKTLMAWSKLRGRGDDSALIVVYAARPSPGKAQTGVLREFAAAMSPSIDRALDAARGASQ